MLAYQAVMGNESHAQTKNNMPNDNRISATITDEVKAQILTKLREITDLLPFLGKLDANEKRGITTIGTEREAMDSTFNAEMSAHPELIPSYVD